MKLPAAKRTGTNVMGSLGRDTGPTFAEAKAIEGQGKGFLGTGLTSRDFGVMADAAMNITNMQGQRQKQQASVKIAQAKEPLERWGAMERIPTTELPQDVLTDEQMTQEYVLSSEVMPALYKRFYEDTIPLAAEGISTKGFRDEWVTNAQEFAARDINNVTARSIAAYEKQVLRDQQLELDTLVKQEKFGLAIGMLDGMNISEAQKESISHGIMSAQARTEITNIANSGDLELIDQTINSLQENGCSKYLTSEQCGSAINSLQNAFNRVESQAYKEQQQVREMFWADVQKGIMDNTYNEADAEYDYNKWQLDPTNPEGLDPQKYISALGKIRSGNAQAIQLNQQMAYVSSVMNGEVLANPTNPDDQKAIDATIENSPGMPMEEILRIAEVSSYTPKALRNMIESQAINGSPVEQAEAAQLYNRLQSTNRMLTTDIDEDVRDTLDIAAVYIRAGADGQMAIRTAKESLQQAPENFDYNSKLYNADIKLEDNVKALNKLIRDDDPKFVSSFLTFGGDSSTVAMQGQFEAMVRDQFIRNNGNIDMARNVAYNRLRTTWGTNNTGSTLSGTELTDSRNIMSYPPTQMLGWEQPQVDRALEMFAEERGIPAESIIVHSNSGTANGSLSWSIATYNKDTQEIDIPLDPDTMQPIEWSPGLYAERIQAEYDASREAEVQKIRDKVMKERERQQTYGRGGLQKSERDRRTALEKFVDFSIGTSRSMRGEE